MAPPREPDDASRPNERGSDASVTEAESSSTPPSSSSSGWKFHPLPGLRSIREDERGGVDVDDDDDCDGKSIVGCSRQLHDNFGGGDDDGDGDTAVRSEDDDDAMTTELVDEFDEDGFLCLSGVLKRRMAEWEGDEEDDDGEDVDTVGTLRDLVMRHVADVFRTLHENGHSAFPLSHRRRRFKCEGAESSLEEGRVVGVEGEGDGGECDVTVSGCGRYEYPMRCGIKNGFREVVMRSPGRYELAILNNNYSRGNVEGVGDVENQASFPPSSSLLMDPVRRHVLSNDDLLRLVRSLLVRHGPDGRRNSTTATSTAPTGSGDTDATGNSELNDNSVCVKDDKCSDRGEEGEYDDEGYRLLSVSIVVSAPGADDQGWHADGGHVNHAKHETCHCLNVFLPLADAEDEEELKRLGPTELRPGTHYHTRNLAPMMLAAMARKTLRPPALPLVRAGDSLIFDYRVLHRGRANATGGGDGGGGGGGEGGDVDGDVAVGSDRGRCRSVLVLTFAQSWFRDVLNFPRRSLLVRARAPPPPPATARRRAMTPSVYDV